MSDDGEPLTSDDDEAGEGFDAAFAPIGTSGGDKDAETDAADASDGGKEDSAASTTTTTPLTGAAASSSSSKKLRERKSGSESGDGKSSVSSPRYAINPMP